MRRVALMLTVAIVMAVMIVVSSAMPAMATSKGEVASGGKVCTPGVENAHESVPENEPGGHLVGKAADHTMTAHSNIPCG